MDDAKLKRQIGGAIRQARMAAGLSQKALAAAVGVEQAQMSRYERGEYLVALDTITKIDRACHQPLGHVLRLAGLVEDSNDVVSLLRTDTNISAQVRDAIITIYESDSSRTVDSTAAATATLTAANAEKPATPRRRPGRPRSA